MANFREYANFIWSVADLIRDSFKRGKYQDVILPLTVLRRVDCVLEPTKEKVLGVNARLKGKLQNREPQLRKASGFALLQHVALRLCTAAGRCAGARGEPQQLHQRLLREHAGSPREVQLPRHDPKA